MRERLWIGAGLALFVILVTYPVWHGLQAHSSTKGPNLVLPAREKECVAPTSFMKTSHMKLLVDWRESVVRNDRHTYVAFNGKTYDMSLTGTCLRCHDKRQFCDRCHTYAGIETPFCWDCHVDPSLAQRSVP
jgi:hypothetical protein